MTPRQRKFCDEYLISGNATDAAIKAGYSPKTAKQTGSENLAKPDLKAYIETELEKLHSAKIADAEEVMKYLTSVMRGEHTEEIPILCGDGCQELTQKEVGAKERLKAAGLSDVSFELVLPQVSYPFSNGGAQSAAYYLSLFERLKVSKTPFQFILNRQKPGGGMFHYTNLTVGLETYEITDDAGEGFDVKVKINLKQYRAYGTKTVTVQPAKTSGGTATATVKAASRPTTTAPKAATYTVKSGDCLWNIAKKQLGNGADYTKIYNLNKDKIKNPNLIYPGQVLTLPS